MTWRKTPCRKDCGQSLAQVRKALFPFRSKHLGIHIKLRLYNALIKSVLTKASLIWEHAVDAHLMKLQRLQNRILRAAGNLDWCTPARPSRFVAAPNRGGCPSLVFQKSPRFQLPDYNNNSSQQLNTSSNLSHRSSVCRLKCCWYSPAQSSLASVSRSLTKSFILP
jgi:hypothetical protein